MIVTLTPNPSLDRTLEVSRLVRGEVLRAVGGRVEAGGKGINLAQALAAHGLPVRAVLPSGGPEGLQLTALLTEAGIDNVTVPVAGAIRANVAVVEPDGTVTKINEPGPALLADEVEALLDATVASHAGAADWIVGSGSLPPGAPVDLYARLVERGRRVGARVAVDTSGPALVAALAAGPDLVKPNHDELIEAAGMPVATLGDAVAAAHRILAAGARSVLATLGAAGALLVADDVVLHGHAPVRDPRSSVGAGDAALAGLLSADGQDRQAALAAAVAWGAAAVRLPGSRMPGPGDLNLAAVTVTAVLDESTPLVGAVAVPTAAAGTTGITGARETS